MNPSSADPEHERGVRAWFDALPYPGKEFLPRFVEGEIGPGAAVVLSIFSPFYLSGRPERASGARILDFGCGSGGKSFQLARVNQDCHVLGADFSAQSIAPAQDALADSDLNNLEFRSCTLTDLTREGALFDYINVDEVLYLSSDPESLLRQLLCCLRPGGVLRANYHSRRNRSSFLDVNRLIETLGIYAREAEGDVRVDDVMGELKKLSTGLDPRTPARRALGRRLDNPGFVMANQALFGDSAMSLTELLRLIEDAGWQLLHFVDHPNWLPERVASLAEEGNWLVDTLQRLEWRDRALAIDAVGRTGRLYDFWCVAPDAKAVPMRDWSSVTSDVDATSVISLHPGLSATNLLNQLQALMDTGMRFPAERSLPFADPRYEAPLGVAELIVALSDRPRTVDELEELWRTFHPLVFDGTKVTQNHRAAEQLRSALDYLIEAAIVARISG